MEKKLNESEEKILINSEDTSQVTGGGFWEDLDECCNDDLYDEVADAIADKINTKPRTRNVNNNVDIYDV